MLIIWFARNVLDFATALITCGQKLCACCDPTCIGYNAHMCLKSCVRQSMVCFCFLQPVFLCLIVVAQRHQSASDTASVTFCYIDANAISATLTSNHTAALNTSTWSSETITCFNIDSIFVMMPYAVLVSINTLAWVSLTQTSGLSADSLWDASLFDSESEHTTLIYECGYYVELWLLNMCMMASSVHGADFLKLFYAVHALTLCLIFFVTCARLSITVAADHLVGITILAYMLSVLVPFWHEMVDLQCSTSIAYALTHAFALFLLCGGHYLTTGQATVAYILTVRLVVTLVVSSTNLITLLLGTQAVCR